MPELINLVGLTYGRWTVLARASDGPSYPRWWCRCVCGTEKVVRGTNLRNGRSASCGCLVVENCRAKATHCRSSAPEYRSWQAMKTRCYRVKNRDYKHYGGRGIRVCARWLAGFEAFLFDMGPRPKGTTLDRKDNNKDYEPSNCRWATHSDQMRNTRTNRIVVIDGESHCIVEWSELTGVDAHLIQNRLTRGITGQALITAPRKQGRLVGIRDSPG